MAAMALTNNGQELIHRDLKTANVFLGDGNPTQNHYRDYPQTFVGDFGLGIFTSPTDERNPDWYSGKTVKGRGAFSLVRKRFHGLSCLLAHFQLIKDIL